jgi:hypothetical protein
LIVPTGKRGHSDDSRRRLDASADGCDEPGDLIESGVFWDISG